jgi:hypothetical protein
MTNSRPNARDLALGAAVNTALVGTYFGALIVWSRFCAAHKCRTQ